MTAFATNSIQIVINAKDEASKAFEGIKDNLDRITTGAGLAQARFAAMSATIVQLANVGITKLSQLSNIVRGLKETIFDTAAGQTIVDQFKQAANAAVSEIAPLSSIFATLTSDTRNFVTEFANVSRASVLDSAADRFQKSFEGSFSSILNLAAKFTPRLVAFFQNNEKFLANTLLKSAIRNKIPAPIKAVLDFAVSEKAINQLEGLFGGKLPESIRETLNSTVNKDFSSKFLNLIQSEKSLQQVFKNSAVSGLAQGSFGKAIEGILAKQATRLFTSVFVKLDSNISDLAFDKGNKIGNRFVNGIEAPFSKLDKLTQGRLSKVIDSLANSASKFLPEGLLSGVAQGLVDDRLGNFKFLFKGISQDAEQSLNKTVFQQAFRGLALAVGGSVNEELIKTVQQFDRGIDFVIDGIAVFFPKFGNRLKQSVADFRTNLGDTVNFSADRLVEKLTEAPLERIKKTGEEISKANELLKLQNQQVAVSVAPTVDEKELNLRQIEQQIKEATKQVKPELIDLGFDELEQKAKSLNQELKGISDRSTGKTKADIAAAVEAIEKANNLIKLQDEELVIAAVPDPDANKQLRELAEIRQKIAQASQEVDPQLANLNLGQLTKEAQKLRQELDDIQRKEVIAVEADDIEAANKLLKLQQQQQQVAASTTITEEQRAKILADINTKIAKLSQEVDPKFAKLSFEQLQQEAQKLNQELAGINQQKNELQQQAINIALNPDLSSFEKENLIAEINRRIDKVGNEIPLEGFIEGLRTELRDLIGEDLFNSLEGNIKSAFENFNNFFGELPTEALTEIGTNAGNKFAAGFRTQVLQSFTPLVTEIDNFIIGSFNKIKTLPEKFADPLEKTGNIVGILGGLRDPLDLFDLFRSNLQQTFGVLAQVGEQLTFFQSGLQVLQGFVQNGPFKLLITQNIQLREQLLATQTSLVSTNNVVSRITGQIIQDNAQAIQALTQPVESAIEDLRKKSLKLVGVTSAQLIESFQIIAGQAGGIGASLEQVTDLTIAFSASLGTLGIPLFQARQEINSILQGTIDVNSVLAESIGLTNPQIQGWKNQGVLLDKLLEKLAAFKAGNEIAARTVGGLTSNIQEVFETVGLIAGKPLVEPIVVELETIYNFLDKNTDRIAQRVSEIAQNIFNGLQTLLNALRNTLTTAQDILGALPEFFGESIGNFLTVFADSLNNALKILEPFIKLLGGVAGALRPILASNPFLKISLQTAILAKGIRFMAQMLGVFVNILPGVGDALFGINLRMLPLVNLLPNLRGQLDKGAGSLLFFGKVLNQIPGLSGQVQSSLQFLGPLAPIITNLIPSIAGVGISLVGLAKVFPPLQGFIRRILDAKPADAVKLLGTALKNLPIINSIPLVKKLGDGIIGLSGAVERNTRATSVSALATKFYETQLKNAALAARTFLIRTALLGAGLFAAAKLITHFIAENKELVQFISGTLEGFLTFFADIKYNIEEFVKNNQLLSVAIALSAITVAAIAFHKALGGIIGLEFVAWAGGAAKALDRLSVAFAKASFVDSLFSLREFLKTSRTVTDIDPTKGVNTKSNKLTTFLETLQASFIVTEVKARRFGTNINKSLQVALGTSQGSQQTTMLDVINASLIVGEDRARKFGRSFKKSVVNLANLDVGLAFKDLISFNKKGTLKALTKGFEKVAKARSLLSLASVASGASLAGSSLKNLILIMEGGTVAASQAAGANVTLAASLQGLALGLFQVLAPLALLAAGIAVIGFIRYKENAEAAGKANDILQKSFERSRKAAKGLADEAKALQEAQKNKVENGVDLSEAELAANKAINRQVRGRIIQLEEEIKGEKEQIELARKRSRAGKKLIADGEARNAKREEELAQLKEITAEIILQNKEITNKPSLGALLLSRSKTLEEFIRKGTGQEEQFASNVNKFVENTQQLLEQGLISTEEAERRLTFVATSEKTNKEGQIKARSALIQVYAEEEAAVQRLAQKTLDLIEISQAERKAALIKEKGFSSDRLARQEQELEFSQEKTKAEIKNSQAQIKAYDNQIKKTKQLAKENKALFTLQIADLIAKLNAETDKIERGLIQEEINTLLAVSKEAALLTPKQIAEIEAKRRAELRKTKNLIVKQAEDEVKAQELSIQRRQELLDRFNQSLSNELTKQTNQLKEQINLYESIEKSLSLQAQIIQSAQELQSSGISLIETQIEFLANTEKSQKKQKQLIEATAAFRLRALIQAQELERKNLEIQQEQNRMALEREKIQNRIAKGEAIANIGQTQAELAVALADERSTPQQIEGLQLRLDGLVSQLNNLGTAGNLIETQLSNLPQLEDFERRKQSNKQERDLLNARIEFANAQRRKQDKDRANDAIQRDVLERLGVSSSRDATIKELSRFGNRTFNQQFLPQPKKAEGFIDLGNGNIVQVEDLVKRANSSKLPKQKVTESFIDFGGGKIEVLPSVTPQVTPFELPQLELPEVSLRSLTSSVQGSLGNLQQGLSGIISNEAQEIVKAIKEGQDKTVSNYNITVNANKQVKQVEGEAANKSVDVNKMVRELEFLAGGI